MTPGKGKLDPKFMVDVDVQKLVEDFVWKKFMKSLFVLRRCFYRRNDFHIDIRWGYFSFKDFRESENIVREEKTLPEVQYSTTYTCHLNDPQKHVFSAQGSTTDSKVVKLQRNYSIGGNLSLNVSGVNFNLSSNESFQSGSENKKETATTWSATSEFTLNSKDSAIVVVEQHNDCKEKDFVVKTRLRLRPTAAGWGAPVTIRRKSDFQIVFEYEIIKLGALFEAYRECKGMVEIHERAHVVKFDDDKSQLYDEVYIISRGILKSENENRTISVINVPAQDENPSEPNAVIDVPAED